MNFLNLLKSLLDSDKNGASIILIEEDDQLFEEKEFISNERQISGTDAKPEGVHLAELLDVLRVLRQQFHCA